MIKIRTVLSVIGLCMLPAFFVFSNSVISGEKGDSDHERGELVGEFVDSLTIGRPGQNKIVVKKYLTDDYLSDDILFYQKDGDGWVLQNREIITGTSLAHPDEQIVDYNNDGYNDFSYIPLIAARSINVLRYLFIYNPETNKLQFIKGAIDYPSLAYNKKLDCLDSHAVYGGSTTCFLKIQADSLSLLADVTLFGDERTLTVYDPYGKETILLNDTLGNPDCVYFRFSDYELSSVLEEYESFCFDR